MERDHLLHPLFARRRTVRMDVHALRHLRIGLAGHHPSAVSKTIGLIQRSMGISVFVRPMGGGCIEPETENT